MTSPTLSASAWFKLLLLSLIWSTSFLFGRVAVLEIPPMTLVFLRVAIAAMALNLFIALRYKGSAAVAAPWRDFAIMGLLNNIVPFGLIFYGQQEIGAGLAAIINSMTPIWSLLIANFTTSDEKLSPHKLLGIVISIVGVATLIGPDALYGLSGSLIAQISVLGATISYGIASVFGRKFAGIAPVETARGQLTASAILILPLFLVVDTPWLLPVPSSTVIYSVLALALLCTAYAYLLFFQILALAGAVNVSLVTILIPPSAIVMSTIFLGESINLEQGIGTAIILAGLIVIDGRLLRL